MKKNFKNEGRSVVEIILVVAIVVVLLAVVSYSISGFRDSQSMKNAVVDVTSSLDKAKSETLAGLNSLNYGVHFQSDKVVIFNSTSYSAGTNTNENINIISPAVISCISIPSSSPCVATGTTDIYFVRLTGIPNNSASLTITSGNLTKNVIINSAGGVSVN